jgi:hypothetical protein
MKRASPSVTLRWLAALALVGGCVCGAAPANLKRALPQPLPQHPGNVFVEGEPVTVSVPAAPLEVWRLLDDEDRTVVALTPTDGRARLGKLPVGFYRLRRAAATNSHWISLGVVAPLPKPTPATSPVALDVAMAWFYPREKMEAVASLCALAGANRVRDRLNWAQMEPQRGRFAGTNQYDASARAQTRAGLRVLQVNHLSPPWAGPDHKRFPTDLRDAFRFHREMARRWRGAVPAFEPWNEADIPMFGGHTGAEMASLQKAAGLGLKAGNPDVIACLNVFAHHKPGHLADLHANEAWPYFDTFNLHHYEAFAAYPKLYADFRAVSAGRPLWVTECAVPVKWAGDDKLKEPTDADLRVQAERLVKTFALSIHEGSAATFYFLLPHYVEGQTQFGLLRPDLTPRPAFLSLAAVGRLMAEAKPLGRVATTNSGLHACWFTGRKGDLLVAWSDGEELTLELPATSGTIYNHLGALQPADKPEGRRPERKPVRLALRRQPIFFVAPKGTAWKMKLTPPPAPAPRLGGKPSPIVFQALWPTNKVALDKSAYRVTAGQPQTIPVFAYNFGARKVSGRLRVEAGAGWRVEFPDRIELQPDERQELALTLTPPAAKPDAVETVKITGDFDRAGKPVLALRLLPEAADATTPRSR